MKLVGHRWADNVGHLEDTVNEPCCYQTAGAVWYKLSVAHAHVCHRIVETSFERSTRIALQKTTILELNVHRQLGQHRRAVARLDTLQH
jgi:hypothetical protein